MPGLMERTLQEDSDSESEDEQEDVWEDAEAHFSEADPESQEEDTKEVTKWLLDTGASIHVDTEVNSVKDEKPSKISVQIADGNSVTPRGVGTKVIHDNKTGYPFQVKMMHVIPEFAKRILSVSKIIDEGFEVQFRKEFATIKAKDGKMIKCPRDKSGLYYFHGKEDESVHAITGSTEEPKWEEAVGEIDQNTGANIKTNVVMKMPKTVDINVAHDVCGHKGEALLKKTYKALGVTLTGTLKACEGCGFAKAKAKAVSKTTATNATKPGERLYLDTTGPFTPTLNGYRYWIQVVDDFTRHGFCEFNKNKTGMGTFIRAFIGKLKAMGMTPKYLRCDNAGEHLRDMMSLCDEFAMTLELTAPDTPQQNGVVERRISVLKQRALAMMITANLSKPIRTRLWCEAVNCANDLENISASSVRDVFPVKMMTGQMSKLFPMLQPFGRIGYVTIRKKFKAVWKEKSEKHLMVGYAKNHSNDTYRMYNPVTRRVSQTRDVGTWAEWSRVDPKKDMSVFNEDPTLLQSPMGLDAVEVPGLTTTFEPPRADLHLIPDDNDFEAGRKREEAPKDTSNISRKISLIEDDDEEDNEATNEATNTKVNKLIDMNEAMNEAAMNRLTGGTSEEVTKVGQLCLQRRQQKWKTSRQEKLRMQ